MKLVSGIVNSGFFAQSALSAEVATKDSLGRNISETYLTGVDLTGYATTAQLDEKLDKADSGKFYPMEGNPSGFLTAHQSLQGYATEQWVESKGYLTGVDIPESANWNGATTVVNNNSAIWNNTTNIVSANSAAWTSGGIANPQIPVTGINGIKISESGDKVVFEVSGSFLTAVPDTYLQNTDLNTTNGKISAISGIPLEDTSNVFVAVYNTTTYNEIASAYDAGKAVVCKYDQYLLNLCYKDNARIIFAGFAGRGIYQYATTERVVQCTNTNLWVNHSYGMQADWNEKNDYAPSYIKNKPDLTQYQTTTGMTAYLTAVPATYLQNTDLTITDGKVTEISGVPLSAGDALPEAVSAATDYVTANSAAINGTVETVSSNSGAWGGSALPISAGTGIGLSIVDGVLVISVTGGN